MTKALVLSLTLATAASLSGIASAQSNDSMMKSDAMKPDCTQAGTMMSTAAKGTAMTSTGDVDKDFAAMMMDREKGSMMLLKIEAACGKDPKTKAMAAKEAAAADSRMQMFRNLSMSQ